MEELLFQGMFKLEPDNYLLRQQSMTPDKPSPADFTIDLTEQTSAYDNLSLNRTRTFSFQAPPQETAQQFCQTYIHLYALDRVGKRITDPNVVSLNSTQKEMVQTIVESNKNRQDQKSKFLTQRANKFLKILWKAEKLSDSFFGQEVVAKPQEKVPRYASPIHNFKKHTLTRNNSFGTLSIDTERTKSIAKNAKKSSKPVNQVSTNAIKRQKEQKKSVSTSRARHFNSEDKKFQRIRLSPKEQKSKDQISTKQQQKSFEIDLTHNIAWKTMMTTKNYQNMLKILQQ